MLKVEARRVWCTDSLEEFFAYMVWHRAVIPRVILYGAQASQLISLGRIASLPSNKVWKKMGTFKFQLARAVEDYDISSYTADTSPRLIRRSRTVRASPSIFWRLARVETVRKVTILKTGNFDKKIFRTNILFLSSDLIYMHSWELTCSIGHCQSKRVEYSHEKHCKRNQ